MTGIYIMLGGMVLFATVIGTLDLLSRWRRPLAEHLGNGVGVEQEGHVDQPGFGNRLVKPHQGFVARSRVNPAVALTPAAAPLPPRIAPAPPAARAGLA